jgi:hypothetical protein
MALPPNDVFSKGFAAGIQVWLIFLLAFYLLGYPAPLAIMLGAIAGISAGFIIGWWEVKDEKPVLEEVVEDSLEEVAETRFRRRRTYARMRHAKNRPEVKLDWETVKDMMRFWKRS